MKNSKIISTALFIVFSVIVNAQIGVGTNIPDPSAVIDISSTSKGLLIPRLHLNEQLQMQFPATGLLVFNIDNFSLEVNSGTPLVPIWISVTGATGRSGGLTTSGAGLQNEATGINAIAFGGTHNIASALNSSTTGGSYNLASNINSATLGGYSNTASGINSSAIGGTVNVAYDLNSSALGGTINDAHGINSSVIGGTNNISFNTLRPGADACAHAQLPQSGASPSEIGGRRFPARSRVPADPTAREFA